jgi:hypothetical protein
MQLDATVTHIRAAATEYQRQHAPDRQPLRNRLDDDAPHQRHDPRRCRARVVNPIHLCLFQRRCGVDDLGDYGVAIRYS